MAFVFDLPGALVKGIALWKQGKRAQKWARLIFTMLFSATVGFLSGMGGALVATEPFLVALGAGMLGAAAGLVAVFLASPLTRGMVAAIPRDVMENRLKKAPTVVRRAKK